MSCSTALSRDFLSTVLPRSWMNGVFRTHREATLFHAERALMPSTQPFVDQELQRRKNVELLGEIAEERMRLKRQLAELERTQHDLAMRVTPALEDRRAFVQKCSKDGCRGFLNMSWKCAICATYTCAECGVNLGAQRGGEAHVCLESDKLTMAAVKKECRRCPGCSYYVYRVDGCDQMFCTQCKTAFSWRTGGRVTGSIHNPHYYAFVRARGTGGGRVLGDIPCGGLPSLRELDQWRVCTSAPRDVCDLLHRVHRVVLHVEHEELPKFRTEAETVDTNVAMRVRYMLGELDDAAYGKQLQRSEKASSKKREIGLILTMFVHTMSDMMRQGVVGGAMDMGALRELAEYANRSLLEVARRYQCCVPNVDIDNGFVRRRTLR